MQAPIDIHLVSSDLQVTRIAAEFVATQVVEDVWRAGKVAGQQVICLDVGKQVFGAGIPLVATFTMMMSPLGERGMGVLICTVPVLSLGTDPEPTFVGASLGDPTEKYRHAVRA